MTRLKIMIRGGVQGVGFRPFVHRLAHELALSGWVQNTLEGVRIEAHGAPAALTQFLARLERDAPPRSAIQSLEPTWLEDGSGNGEGFFIRPSDDASPATPTIPADIALCAECRHELTDPGNRRYRYPFINCTQCGPRFSIIEAFPYDRERTTMRAFPLCPRCRREYEDPADRRFHAEPNACPDCGPQLALWNSGGRILRTGESALRTALAALQSGRIVALKGVGGYHLLVDAADEAAVRRLRQRKAREEKPFAVMFPTLAVLRTACHLEPLEARLIQAPEAPIVLLRRRADGWQPAPAVAPGNPNLGAMLPYSPLHLLLLTDFGRPLVMTSGNRSEEPLCYRDAEALERLGAIADVFLVHNRAIAHPIDDSVACLVAGREMLLRRARGYAPLPVGLRAPGVEDITVANTSASGNGHSRWPVVLAVGGLQKSTLSVVAGERCHVSQHLGDLESEPVERLFRRTAESLLDLLRAHPERVACDLHPDYLSTRLARTLGLPLVPVQHHHAHVLSCMAENELTAPVLGVAWDGTGLGTDRTLWGGEFLVVHETGFRRAAALRPFPLPGGDRAAREPRRSAIGLLHAWEGEACWQRQHLAPLQSFRPPDLALLRSLLARPALSPWTSSVGRLFDAVAALVGLCSFSRFEGQAAMALEFLVDPVDAEEAGAYPLPVRTGATSLPTSPPQDLDWAPLLVELCADLERHVPPATISARFHHALARAIVDVAQLQGIEQVVLTGGCFQNRYLTACTVRNLRRAGFRPAWHQRVPPNDGGLSLGQAVAALQAAGQPAEVPASSRPQP